MAAGEKSRVDSRGQSYMGGSGRGMGRSGGDEGVNKSRFLARLRRARNDKSLRVGADAGSDQRHKCPVQKKVFAISTSLCR